MSSLRHYVDFRPGYPPIGKIPIYLIYSYMGGNEFAVMVYNVATFNVSVIIFYYLIRRLKKNEATFLKVAVLYALNPAAIAAILQSHADFLALSFVLVSILVLIEGKIRMTALSIALGFLTKVYPIFILIPAVIVVRGRNRMTLLVTFIAAVWLISLPFLVLDPLMHLSTFVHHLYRGPSESIIAVLDKYHGHTDFVHPLFDAAIYYFHFNSVYQPSHEQHFYYAWRNPLLKYFALTLQLMGMLPLCLYALRNQLRGKPMNTKAALILSILAFFTFLSMSPTQNMLTHIPAYALACLLLAFYRSRLLAITTVIYALINGLHAVCWTLFHQYIEFALFTISNLRTSVVAFTYLSILNYFRGRRL